MRKYFVAAAAAVAAAGSAVAQDLKMATLPANLPPAVIMATFANVVSSEVDGLNIEVAAGGAATAHMMEVGAGNIDMSMTSPVVWNLMKAGARMYANKENAPALADDVQLLMWFPYGAYHFTVRADSDIQTLDDLEGASVFLGPTGGGAWNGAYGWVKATTGLDAKAGDYEAIDANWVTGYQAFLDGTIDMYVTGCGSILVAHSCKSLRPPTFVLSAQKMTAVKASITSWVLSVSGMKSRLGCTTVK